MKLKLNIPSFRLLMIMVVWFAAVGICAEPETKQGLGKITVAVIPPYAAKELQNTVALIAQIVQSQLQKQRIPMVDRERIDRLLAEVELNDPRGVRQRSLKAGRLVGATRLIVGKLAQDKEKRFEWTVKVLNAQTGLLLDLQIMHFTEDTAEKTAGKAVARIAGVLTGTAASSSTYLGIGTFENMSPGGRFATLSDELRSYLEKHFTNGNVRVVERGFLEALLEEVELSRGGFTDGTSSSTPIPACCLISGLYQSHHNGEDRITLNMRISTVGGRASVQSLDHKPGPDLYRAIAAAVTRNLAKTTGTSTATTKQEAAEHHKRGVDLSGLLYMNTSYPSIGGVLGRRFAHFDPKERKYNVRNAIQELRAALLLNSMLVESRLFLGICLSHSGEGRKAVSRLKQVVAMAPDSKMAYVARERLVGLEAADSRDYLVRLKRYRSTVTNRDHLAELDRRAAAYVKNHKDVFSVDESTQAYVDAAIATCNAAKSRVDKGKHIHVYELAEGPFSHILHRVKFDRAVWLKQCQLIAAAIHKHDPKFAPYFETAVLNNHLDRIPDWKKRVDTLMDTLETDTKAVHSIACFAENALPGLMGAVVRKKEYEIGIRLGEFCHKHARARRYWRSYHRIVSRYLVDCYFNQKQWAKALPYCQRYYPLETQDYCRKQMGLAVSSRPKPTKQALPEQVGLPPLDGNRRWTCHAEKDSLYFYGNQKVFVLKPPSKEQKTFTFKGEIKGSVTCMRRTGNTLWLGTSSNGIYACNTTSRSLRHYTVEKDGLPFNHITCMEVAEGKVWFGFRQKLHGGIGYVDCKTGTFSSLYPKLKKGVTLSPYYSSRENDPHDAAPRQHIIGIISCGDGCVYVAAKRKGVQRFDVATKKWTTIFKHREVNRLAAVPGHIAFGIGPTHLGVYVYDANSKKLTTINEKSHGYTIRHTFGMTGSQGHFWIDTNQGVMVIDAKNKMCKWTFGNGRLCASLIDGANKTLWAIRLDNQGYRRITVPAKKEGQSPGNTYHPSLPR